MGDIDISGLPKCMRVLYLHENAFDGELRVGESLADLCDLKIDEVMPVKPMRRLDNDGEEQENTPDRFSSGRCVGATSERRNN